MCTQENHSQGDGNLQYSTCMEILDYDDDGTEVLCGAVIPFNQQLCNDCTRRGHAFTEM